ncbi:putative wsc domain-containing protein [Botrytis cinerea BcDW1]|uniref:Putative wsc domain-containing protein n=1 Tax=Botryotinia fuckeliana (strain BcDW1) TaxID=1290391 RepID=M7TKS4_BOTF1|nr:putative wsc domain-containing protein [Botrytis cinerea BcDW1]
MILSNLFIASLGIISVTSSQSFSAINVCLDALSSEPNNAKDFCIQFLVSSTIPIPSFASPCLGTDPSDNQLFKSCYEVLHQFEKEVPLPELSHLGLVDEPVKREETLPRDGGFFNTGSVLSVTTNVGTYDNFGCFEDGTRGKPLGSPLLNLTGPAADTIRSCVNACSISGQNGIPYRYAGIEPGFCWCSNYISILSVKTASFCQSTCPSNYGKYCGGIVGGVLHMQIYELKKMNPTSTTSAKTTFTSSLKSSVKSSISASQSGTTSSSKLLSLTTQTSSQKSSSISKSTSSSSTRFTSSISSVPGFSTTSKIPIISLSTIIESSTTTKSFGLPPDPPTIPPIVGPTGTESYVLPPGTFAYPSELPTLTQSFGLPPDPPTIPPIAGPTGTESYILPSGTFAYPSRASTTANPNPWASLTLEEPEFWTQVPSGAVPGYVEPTTTLQPISTATSPSQKFKREYDITAPDSPWLPLLPLTSPEILKEVLPGQVPGWDQHAIAKHKKLKSREYDINAPDSPWFPLLPLTSPEILKEVAPDQVPGWKQQAIVSRSDRTKREYDVKAPDSPWIPLLPPTSPEIFKEVAPDQVPGWKQQSVSPPPTNAKREYDIFSPSSPWRPILPLYTPSILKSVPEDQVPGWRGKASAPLILNFDIPPKPKPKTKHRRQLGPLPENFLEPPGRPDFIKAYPEKDNNKPLPPPFNKMLNAVDPTTGTKFPTLKTKPRYSHSKISLKEFPSLEEIGLGRDGREHHHKEDDEDTEEAKRISDLQKIRDRRYAHKLHLQGTPKAYAELAEKTERRARKGRKKMDMEDWEKRIFMAVGSQGKGEEVDPLLRDDVIIDRVLLGEDERDGEGEDGEAENWIWGTWSGGEGKRKGRKIRLER